MLKNFDLLYDAVFEE